MEKVVLGWNNSDTVIQAGVVLATNEDGWTVRPVGYMSKEDMAQFICNYMEGKGIDELCHNGMKVKFEK